MPYPRIHYPLVTLAPVIAASKVFQFQFQLHQHFHQHNNLHGLYLQFTFSSSVWARVAHCGPTDSCLFWAVQPDGRLWPESWWDLFCILLLLYFTTFVLCVWYFVIGILPTRLSSDCISYFCTLTFLYFAYQMALCDPITGRMHFVFLKFIQYFVFFIFILSTKWSSVTKELVRWCLWMLYQ